MNTFSSFSECFSAFPVLEASVTDDANFTVLTVVAGVVDVNSEAVLVVDVVNGVVVVVDAIFRVDDDDVAIFDVVVVVSDSVTSVVSVSCVVTAVKFDA